MKDENLGLTANFSVLACETAERERRRGRRAPQLGEMADFGAGKDSPWSAQAFVGKLALPILPALPACPVGLCKVCCVGLPGAWEPFPGACRGFALCNVTMSPSTCNTHQLWRLRRGLQHACKMWGRLQGWITHSGQVSRGWVTHSKQISQAWHVGAQELWPPGRVQHTMHVWVQEKGGCFSHPLPLLALAFPLPWALPGRSHCRHPWALHP